jgi:chitin disaccharide deacetylase
LVEPVPDTYLIVNADDFGLSPGVNRGIARAHEEGIVTSASLMVEQTAAEGAAAYARRQPSFDVGLHIELQEGRRDLRLWSRARRGGPAHHEEIRVEVESQLARFRELIGEDPSHVDSHRHRHRYEPARSVLLDLTQRLGIPLRESDGRIRFCGEFYGQQKGRPWPEGIQPAALVELIEGLPPGVTELCTHPGYADDVDQHYKNERAVEVETLCEPSVRAAIDRLEIRLITFRELNLAG